MSGGLGSAERFVLAVLWSLSVIAASIEVLVGLIWLFGDVSVVFGPQPLSQMVLIRASGIALFIIGSLFAVALVPRFGSVWTLRLERQDGSDTARRLLILTVLLVALGVALDVERGDGRPFHTATLGLLDVPAIIAAVLIFMRPRLLM